MAKSKKTQLDQTQQILGFTSIVAAAYFVSQVVESIESSYLGTGISELWSIFPGKLSGSILLIAVIWSWTKAGRLKLLTSFALGMFMATSAVWLFLA